MIIERDNRGCRVGPDSGVGDSFKRHNERMREFRRSCANVRMVNGRRLDRAALIQDMRPWRACRTLPEAGGMVVPEGTMDGGPLVTLWKVARHKLSPN
jgi:hypothetical protein